MSRKDPIPDPASCRSVIHNYGSERNINGSGTLVRREERLNIDLTLFFQVRELLMKCGAEKLLPIFAKKRVTYKQILYADSKILSQLGVESEYMRSQLLLGAEQLLAGHQNGGGAVLAASAPAAHLDDSLPTAPPNDGGDESLQPSAPPVVDTFQSAECVVCMERTVSSLPCITPPPPPHPSLWIISQFSSFPNLKYLRATGGRWCLAGYFEDCILLNK